MLGQRTRRWLILLALGAVLGLLLSTALFVYAGGWEHTSHGPEGGDIQALAVDSGGNLYAGARLGWVFRGTFSGPNLLWTLKNSGFAASSRDVLSLAIAPNDDVYAGTNDGGVWRSTDDGTSWEAITNSGLGSKIVRTLRIHSGVLYAGVTVGVYTRTLAASTATPWTRMGTLSFHTRDLAAAGGTFYAGSENAGGYWGVYRWTGADWTEMRAGLPDQVSVRALVANGSILYASAEDTTQGYGVYWCNTAVTTTWQTLGTLPAGEACQVRALVLDGSTLYAGTENGVYVWTGLAWSARNTDPDVEAGQPYSNAHRVRALLRTATGTLYAGTPGRGVYRTTDGGVNWSTANGTPPGNLLSAYVVRAIAVNPAYDWRIYAGVEGGGIHRSQDGGASWERRSGIIGDRDVQALAVTHPSGFPVYAGTNTGIYTTTNGITWTLASNGLTTTQALNVYAVAIDPVSSTIVYAGTGGGVYKTTNSGVSWVYKRVKPSGEDYTILALAIDPLSPTIIYAGTPQNGVFRSTNAGETWTEFNTNLPTGEARHINALTVDIEHTVFAGVGEYMGGIYKNSTGAWQLDPTGGLQPVYALVVNPITPTIVLAGTGGGGVLFYGDPAFTPSDEWRALNEGLKNYHIYSLAIDDYVTQTLHAGTAGSGVFDFTWGPPPPPPPEMGISKDDGRTEVSLGQLITYTIYYANNGDEVGTGIVITEVIPTYTVFVYSDLPFHTQDGRTFTTTIAGMAGGSSYTTRFVVRTFTNTVNAPASLTNRAYIRDDGAHGPDPREDNNACHDTTRLGWVDLRVTKTDGVSVVHAGDTVTYTITCTNTGRSDADGVTLTEVFTGHATYIGSGWTHLGGNRYSRTVGTVPGGGGAASATFVIRVNVDATMAMLRNEVQVSDDGAHGPDLTPEDTVAFDQDTVIVNVPDLAVTKSDGRTIVAPGEILTYTITYTNHGAVLAQGIVVTETIPLQTVIQNGAGWSLVSGRVYTRTVPDLLAGQSAAVSISVRVNESAPAGPITNTVSVCAIGEESFDYNTAIDVDQVQIPTPDLVVTKSDGRAAAAPGDIITYTIAYTNVGTAAAQGIVITETIPAYTTIHNGAAWQWVSGRTYTRAVPDLPVGQSAAVSISVRIVETIPASSIVNTVSIRARDETDFTGNIATDTDLVTVPDLEVTKSDGRAAVVPGDTLTYTITYTNVGAAIARGIVLTETLPHQTTFLAGAGWQLVSGQTYTRTVADLPTGQVAAVTIAVRVSPTALPGPITNTVSIRAIGERDFSRNTAADTDQVLPPDLTVTKTDGATIVAAGDTLTYTITYTNVGAAIARGIVVTETIPNQTTFLGGAGWQLVSGQTYTRTVADLPAGQAAAVTLAVRVSPAALPGPITNTVSIRARGEVNLIGNTAADTDQVLPPDLTVTKTDGATIVAAGDTLTYTITYTNVGAAIARGIALTETLPHQTTFLAGAGWQLVSGQTYTRTVADLPAGQAATVTLAVRVSPAALPGPITNTVSIRARGEVNLIGNTATDTDWVVEHAPDLVFTSFSDGVTATLLCQPLVYTIHYANIGDWDATGVAITATLPPSATYLAGGWTPLGGNRYRQSIGTVAQGSSGQTSLTMALTNTWSLALAAQAAHGQPPLGDLAAAVNWPNELTVQVVIGCAEPEDQSNNTASDTDILRRPDLTVTAISTTPTQPIKGQPATIYVTVKNLGDATTYLPGCCHGFHTDLYVDLGHAPGGGEYSNVGKYEWVGAVSAHGTQIVQFSYTFTTVGTHTLYAQANPDRYSTIPEVTFANNTSAPQEVTVIPEGYTLYLPLITKTYHP